MPPDAYGRNPLPGCEPRIALAMMVVTLLSPNSKLRLPLVSSKKFGA